MRFQRKMAGVKEMDFGVRVITLECISPGRQKEGIMQIGSHDVITIGQSWNEISKHVGRSWESVQ